MKRQLVATALLLQLACADTASQLDDALVFEVVGPPSEYVRRSGSPDLFDFATAHWRFYDDYLDLQPPACDDDSDGGAPDWPYLWRHGAESAEFLFVNGTGGGWRGGLDVSGLGIVVLQTDERLWSFSVDGGAPLHADRASQLAGAPGVAVFATDTLLWTRGEGAPSLYDLEQARPPFETWKVAYSWRAVHGQVDWHDGWASASPSVQRDGSLIWANGTVTRALLPSGTVKWEAPGGDGTFLVTADDVVVRSKAGELVAFDDDGGVRWQATVPAGVAGVVPSVLVDEGRSPSVVLPTWYETERGGGLLVNRRARDGVTLGLHDTLDAGALGELRLIGADLDGWLYLHARGPGPGFSLSARTAGLEHRWRVPSQELEFAPLVSASGDRLVTIDRRCRVNLLERATGATLASHRMVGKPGRFLPRLFNGVLYVVAELRTPETVKPSQLHGRRRPDGGLIDAADYGCYQPFLLDTVFCPSVVADFQRRVYALYAFQVE